MTIERIKLTGRRRKRRNKCTSLTMYDGRKALRHVEDLPVTIPGENKGATKPLLSVLLWCCMGLVSSFHAKDAYDWLKVDVSTKVSEAHTSLIEEEPPCGINVRERNALNAGWEIGHASSK